MQFFPVTSVISNTFYPIWVNIIGGAKKYVKFLFQNVILVPKTLTIPFNAIINVISLLSLARLKPNDLGLNKVVDESLKTIGIPWFVSAFVFLLPFGSIELQGNFLFKLFASDENQILKMLPNLQTYMLTIRAFCLSIGISLDKNVSLDQKANKRAEITVIYSNYRQYGTAALRPQWYFPNSEGLRFSLPWLFAVLFIPSIGTQTSSKTSFGTQADYIQLNKLIYSAVIPFTVLNLITDRLLYWYFNGNFVAPEKPKSSGGPMRDPVSGSVPTASREPRAAQATSAQGASNANSSNASPTAQSTGAKANKDAIVSKIDEFLYHWFKENVQLILSDSKLIELLNSSKK